MTSTAVDLDFKIDKTNWTPVCLGDVVGESREIVRDPVKEGIEKVVGLEHIDSESIHLRRWETLEQSTTFTKKFVKGQVLFGRRRAYLKKAALAPFDGICSGDITVLEAKENLLPELLPFLINNDKFFDFAVKNSAGSLSPRAKFKDLASYEFLLPPKDQQARLAKLLWAEDEIVENELGLAEKAKKLRATILTEVYSRRPVLDRSFKRLKLSSIIKLSSGISRPKEVRDNPIESFVYPVYGGNGIIGYADKYMVDSPTIILGRVGEYCGVVHDSTSKSWISDNALYIKEFLVPINLIYLSRYLEYLDLNKLQNRSSHPLITQEKVYDNEVSLLNERLINKSLGEINSIENAITLIENRINNSKQLQKSLINQIF